ncbi:MAG: NAD(P)-binding domain-containing protein [Pseudomonadota bacterium]
MSSSQGLVRERFCIIGAGPSGLAAAKNLKQAGIPFDCFEATGDVGGLWNPGNPGCAYSTVHLNISKKLMRFTDHPIPSGYPDFLNLEQAFAYLKSYAEKFRLYDNIVFNKKVSKAEKNDAGWDVWVGEEAEPRPYRGMIVANGHHWDPAMPEITGQFDGEVMHSYNYTGPEQLIGKRVLIMGGGNSGLDIACDAAFHGKASYHSLRRGYYVIPKVIFGRPTDMVFEKLKRLRLPRWISRSLAAGVMRLIVGPYEKYGLPKPKGKMFAHHPTASSRYLDLLRHGQINICPDIEKLAGNTVCFKDGTRKEIDLLVYGTGYKLSMPFFNSKLAEGIKNPRKLFLNLFHKTDNSLFFVGLFQPADGGFWQLADYQSKLMTRYILATDNKEDAAEKFDDIKATTHFDVGHGEVYTDSPRHHFEVDHYRYRGIVDKLLSQFPALETPPANTSYKRQELVSEAQPL